MLVENWLKRKFAKKIILIKMKSFSLVSIYWIAPKFAMTFGIVQPKNSKIIIIADNPINLDHLSSLWLIDVFIVNVIQYENINPSIIAFDKIANKTRGIAYIGIERWKELPAFGNVYIRKYSFTWIRYTNDRYNDKHPIITIKIFVKVFFKLIS